MTSPPGELPCLPLCHINYPDAVCHDVQALSIGLGEQDTAIPTVELVRDVYPLLHGTQNNPLTPNDPYRGRTAPLTSKR